MTEAAQNVEAVPSSSVPSEIEPAERTEKESVSPRSFSAGVPRRTRLATEIAIFQARFRHREAGRYEAGSWEQEALRLTDLANDLLSKGCIDEGWHALHAARRAEIPSMTPEERRGRAVILLEEAISGKLARWRGPAIRKLLGDVARIPDPIALAQAAQVRDDGLENEFRRLGHLSAHLGFMALTLSTAVLTLLAVVLLGSSPLLPGDSAGLACVFLFGILGGSVSAVRPVLGQRTRLPEMLQTWKTAFLRPLVGGSAALAVSTLAQSGLFGLALVPESRSSALLFFAFVAGFSERLVMRTVEHASSLVSGAKDAKPS
ncbi:MAG TPA: hypothetical protein VMK12_02805 [Anaeromyxobacteraceae bacterium]|nr:hypothetical protein [Anaeromyxobacteraceae bacterium]